MKTSQILSIVITLLIAIGLVTWLAQAAPKMFNPDTSSTSTAESDGKKSQLKKLDYEVVNPFELTNEGSQPKAEVPEPIFNFGDMLLGTTGKHDFIIRNTGEAPLKIAKGPSQCKCTVGDVATNEIPPGGEATASLEWTPTALGEFGQQAVVWTNDSENPRITLRVEGVMHEEIVAQPVGGWSMGTVSKTEPETFSGAIYSAIRKDFHILKVEATSPSIQVSWRELNDEDKLLTKTDYGFKLEGTLRPDGTVGRFHERVIVTTDLESHPTFTFPITANRLGPVTFVGRNWTAGEQLINLKEVDQAKGKSTNLTMLIERFDGKMEFQDIKCVPGFLEVDVKEGDNSAESKLDRFTMTISVPPNSPIGLWSNERRGSIVMKTTHPEVQEIAIAVQMDIVPSESE